MSGGVENVIVDDVHLQNVGQGLRIKAGLGRGGYVKNIKYNNVNMDNSINDEAMTTEAVPTFAENVESLEEIKTTPVPSFNEAFLVARTELGPGNTFEWNGNLYSTNYADELPDVLQSEVAVEDILIDETEPQLSQVDEDESLAFSNSK